MALNEYSNMTKYYPLYADRINQELQYTKGVNILNLNLFIKPFTFGSKPQYKSNWHTFSLIILTGSRNS